MYTTLTQTWEDVQIVQHMFARGGNGAVHRANVRGMPVVIKTILPVCCGGAVLYTWGICVSMNCVHTHVQHLQGTEGVAAAVASQALHREAAVTGRVRQTFGPGGHPHILGVVGVVKPCPGVGLGIVLPLMEGGNAWDFWCRYVVECLCGWWLCMLLTTHPHQFHHHTSYRWAVPAQSQLYKLLCAVELAGSAACGVAGLHCAGLAHRDVKGENLLLHPPTRSFGGLPVPGVGVMADFGSCREAGTVPGHLAGTQGYVAVCVDCVCCTWVVVVGQINITVTSCTHTPDTHAHQCLACHTQPELVLAAEQGVGVVTGLSDVWGIGCMLVNFLTGINVGTNLVFTPTAEIEELLAQVLLGACGVEGIQVADTIFNCVKGCLCEDPSQWWSASVLAMRQVLVCTSLCLLSVAWRLCCVVTVDC